MIILLKLVYCLERTASQVSSDANWLLVCIFFLSQTIITNYMYLTQRNQAQGMCRLVMKVNTIFGTGTSTLSNSNLPIVTFIKVLDF